MENAYEAEAYESHQVYEAYEAYEVPTLVEIGGYRELTRGSSAGPYIDGGTVPWIYSHFRPVGGGSQR
jgi:hypothetical protein